MTISAKPQKRNNKMIKTMKSFFKRKEERMTEKEKIIDKYKSGFVIRHDEFYECNEEWLLDEENTTGNELHFCPKTS